MAVDLARLSLWLATLARDHEFTFLDHALKHGDSLIGLTRKEIEAANWDASKPGLSLYRKMIKESVDRALEGREAIRNAPDDVIRTVQESRHARVEHEVDPARAVGDAVIAAFFSADKAKAREKERATVESWITAHLDPRWDRIEAKAAAFRADQGWRPFHWEIEFPEVFARDNPGFDAIVGNPPYLGSSSLGKAAGQRYTSFLRNRHEGTAGKCDLAAFFLRGSASLARSDGCIAFVTTNTIVQGDTRDSGMMWLCRTGFVLRWAMKREIWPGEASVHISRFAIQKRKTALPVAELNGKVVGQIDPFFSSIGVFENAHRLAAVPALSIGVKQRGDGFFLKEEEIGELGLTGELQSIQPIWGGDDIKNAPTEAAPRFTFNLNRYADERELATASQSLVDAVRERVWPARRKLSGRLKSHWWIWEFDPTRTMRHSAYTIAIPETGPHLSIRAFSGDTVFSQTVYFLSSDNLSPFAVLQSRIHEIWARFFSSSMKDDLRYAPSDCFETFPFPPGYETDLMLEANGQAYHDHRAELMVAANEGMTKTYNRFHKEDERGAAILRLRELHDQMDLVVLRAYGWGDLAETLRPEFLTEETEDDHTYQGRYFWPAGQRDLVLSRLLALNAERHAEEVKAGVAPAKRKRGEDEDGSEKD